MKKKILIVIGLFIVFAFAGLVWFEATYSMDDVESYTIGNEEAEKTVLIATQGSEYKNKLTDSLVDFLTAYDIYISVKDVKLLPEVVVDDWDAIVIIHTFEIWKPQEDADAFLKEHYDAGKMIVHGTSATAGNKIEDVDAITGASIISDIPSQFKIIESKLSSILALN
ncbi:MAG: hypothetical protein GQ574_07035 [Crocinitomix sp.]|nr:hypothetical protein [Crocinitomix sp.]